MEPLIVQTYTRDDHSLFRQTDQTIVPAIFRSCNDAVAACDAWKYVAPMKELMQSLNGRGLTANQVGLSIPLFVFYSEKEGEIIPVFRPKFLTNDSYHTSKRPESCLSFPTVKAFIQRYNAITVEFIAEKNNKRRTMSLSGMDARVFLHEFDHINGMTILDRAEEGDFLPSTVV